MRIYKLLSVLLEYPDRELLDSLPDVRAEVERSPDIEVAERAVLRKFLDHLEGTEPTELQTAYVQTFDFAPEHSLHLTHHLFGDDSDRNRGPALIDLGELYKDYGMETATNELPDYLPLILEFASCLEDESEAKVFLSDAGKVLGALAGNLHKAGSPYAPLLSIVEGRATLMRLAA